MPPGYELVQRDRARSDALIIHVQKEVPYLPPHEYQPTICGQKNTWAECYEDDDMWYDVLTDTPSKKFCRICNARLRKMLEGGA